MTKLKPLGDRIIVKRSTEQEKTLGGLFIPDVAKEKPIEGTVLAAGTGKTLESGAVVPLGVKAGDRILFSKYAGMDVKVDGEDLLIVREEDVLAVVVEAA